QNYKYNLKIRTALENIYQNYKGDKNNENWKNFEIYLKRIWFSNGIHHHYSNDKIKPGFPQTYLQTLLKETKTNLDTSIVEILFNDVDAKKVNLNQNVDLVQGSAVNPYGKGLTANDVETVYGCMVPADSLRPLSAGLSSKLVRTEAGKIEARMWRSGGMYGAAIDTAIFWLEKAVKVAENKPQAEALNILIDFYKTGELKKWDDYNVAWVK